MKIEHVKIARQPIIDAKNRLFAHEWLYRDFENRKSVSPRVASSHLLLTLLNRSTHEQFENESKAFLNIDAKFLGTGIIESLPKEHFIFDIDADHEFRNKDKEMMLQLQKNGFIFSLDNVDMLSTQLQQHQKILPLFDFIKINSATLQEHHTKTLQALTTTHTLIAHKIEDMTYNAMAQKMPFDYFQGYYIAIPNQMELSIVPLVTSHVNQLYVKLQSKIQLPEIAAFIDSKSDLKYYFSEFCSNFDLYNDKMTHNTLSMLESLGFAKLTDWTLMLIYSKVSNS